MNVKNSIIPALSNNKHELFHSNLWQWLIEQDHSFVKVFFDKFKIDNYEEVKREDKHLDLTIIDNDNNYYIIENKVKSIPSKRQLEEYKTKIDKKKKINKKSYLLISLMQPQKDMLSNGWEGMSYLDMSKKLKKFVKKSNKKIIKKYKYLLIEYCKYIEYMDNEITNNKYVSEKKYFIDENKIEGSILKDTLKKIKMEKLKEYMQGKLNKYNEELSKKGYAYRVFTGFYNTYPTLTIRICDKEKLKTDKKHQGIEIQIEGKQYRFMVRIKKRLKKDSWETALNIFGKTGFIVPNSKIENKDGKKIIHGYVSSMEGDHCNYKGKYEGDIDGVYQYYNLEDIKYKDLAERVCKDFEEISKNILSKEKFKEYFTK